MLLAWQPPKGAALPARRTNEANAWSFLTPTATFREKPSKWCCARLEMFRRIPTLTGISTAPPLPSKPLRPGLQISPDRIASIKRKYQTARGDVGAQGRGCS